MMIFRLFIPALLTILMLPACGNDDDGSSSPGGSFFSCQIDGEVYRAEGILAYATSFSDGSIGIYGLTENGPTVYLSLQDGGSVGNYVFNTDDGNGFYIDTDDNSFTTIDPNGSGMAAISSLEGNRIIGTFSFTAVDVNGNTANISAGEFDVELR